MSVPKYLYHGTSVDLIEAKKEYLEPQPSGVTNDEKAVFAAHSRALAAAFIPQWSDREIQLQTCGRKLYIIENLPGTLELLKKSGHIYRVDGKHFKTDHRLGLQGCEFICKRKVAISATHAEFIPDCLEFLKSQPNVKIITFKEMQKFILKK